MSTDLAPCDWTNTHRGVILAIDTHSGIGVIATANQRGEYLIFFLQDIMIDNGWQNGIGEKDNVEFEIGEMNHEDIDYIRPCYLLKKYDHKLSKHSVAHNVAFLEPGTVILEKLLFDHPRYEGIVHTEPMPSVQHHAFGSYYGDDEPRNGVIRLIGPYHDTQIPPIQERYEINEDDEEEMNNKAPTVLLKNGTKLHFEGKDLLSSRIVIRKGDRVEFDVYKDQSHREISFGATNIVFLDGCREEKKHGFIYRFLSSSNANQQKFGLIKSTYHEELFWHESEVLDRDQMNQLAIGDEVEFIRTIDEKNGRLKCSRIQLLPKGTIQLTEISKELFEGKVEQSGYKNQAALIKYLNFENGSRPLVEVELRSNDKYILVKGDSVSFRLESKHENPTNKRAVHVVVTKEVDRTHKGTVCSLNESRSDKEKYGEIEYVDRGGKKHKIFFYLIDWFDPSGNTIDIYPSLDVEFNILELSNQSKRAVRIRPLILPLTKEERMKQIKEKMIREHLDQKSNNKSQKNKKQNQQKQQQKNSKNVRKKPPILSGPQPQKMQKQQKEENSADELAQNSKVSKAARRKMRKKRTKINKSPSIASSNTPSIPPSKLNKTTLNETKNEKKINKKPPKKIIQNDVRKVMNASSLNSNNKSSKNAKMPIVNNPIPSFDLMTSIEGIVLEPMRSKKGSGIIKYQWNENNEEKTIEYTYDQKANWQRSIFLTEGDKVRLFFRSIDENDACLAYVALLDPVFKQRRYGQCYYYHPTKEYYIHNEYGSEYIELWSYHIVDKKVQSYNLEDELIVFEFTERPNYKNSNQIATRCRWVKLDEKEWKRGKIETVPKNIFDFGSIKYDGIHQRIRYSQSSLNAEYRKCVKIGDDVRFHIEQVVTKSTYDIIPPTAIHVDSAVMYRPKVKKNIISQPRYVRKNKQQTNEDNDN